MLGKLYAWAFSAVGFGIWLTGLGLSMYSKEPNNRDGVLTGGLRPPDPPNMSASGLHGNMDVGCEIAHFRGGRRPTYLEGLGGEAPQ